MELHKTVLEDICAVIGLTATLRLSAWYGDADCGIWVPLNVEEGQVLVNLVGMPAARRLSAEWGGKALRIPKLTLYTDDVRKRLVGMMLELGFSTHECAGQLKISQRRVQQILRELEAAGLVGPIGPVEKSRGKNAGEKSGGKMPVKSAVEKSHRKREGRKPLVLRAKSLSDLKALLQQSRQDDRFVSLSKVIQDRNKKGNRK
jgi:hypothetical protein